MSTLSLALCLRHFGHLWGDRKVDNEKKRQIVLKEHFTTWRLVVSKFQSKCFRSTIQQLNEEIENKEQCLVSQVQFGIFVSSTSF